MPDLSKRPDQVAKEGNAYRVRGREGGGEEDLKSAMEKYDKARIIHSLHDWLWHDSSKIFFSAVPEIQNQ